MRKRKRSLVLVSAAGPRPAAAGGGEGDPARLAKRLLPPPCPLRRPAAAPSTAARLSPARLRRRFLLRHRLLPAPSPPQPPPVPRVALPAPGRAWWSEAAGERRRAGAAHLRAPGGEWWRGLAWPGGTGASLRGGGWPGGRAVFGAPASAGPAWVNARGQARVEAPTAASVRRAAGAAREEKSQLSSKCIPARRQALGSALVPQPPPPTACLPPDLAFRSFWWGGCVCVSLPKFVLVQVIKALMNFR